MMQHVTKSPSSLVRDEGLKASRGATLVRTDFTSGFNGSINTNSAGERRKGSVKPASLWCRYGTLARPGVVSDTLSPDNGGASGEAYSAWAFRFATPRSIHPRRKHRLFTLAAFCAAQSPTLWASFRGLLVL